MCELPAADCGNRAGAWTHVLTTDPDRAHTRAVMDPGHGDGAGFAVRALARFGLHEGVPAYIALLVAILILFLLSAVL